MKQIACLTLVLVFTCCVSACSSKKSGSSAPGGGGGGGDAFRFEPKMAEADPGDTVNFTLLNGTPPYQLGYVTILSYDSPADAKGTFNSSTGVGSYIVGPNPDCTDVLAAQDSTGASCVMDIYVGGGGGSSISANFTAAPRSGDAPLTVNFTDTSTSTAGITSWSWNFGDGGTSTGQNPSHTYSADGTYNVSLTVTGPDGSDTETKNSYITVTAIAGEIHADFYATPASGAAPLTVDFTDQSTSTSGIDTWSWNFGDGGSSAEQNPGHQYTAEGTYSVTLTVSGADGTDSETKSGYITVYAGGAVPAHTDCTAVFDPKLKGGPKATIIYAVEPAGHVYQVDVKIMDGNSQVRLLVDDEPKAGGQNFSVEWDGKNDAGKFVDPDTYQVVVEARHDTVTPTTAQGEINVVRLGVVEITFEDASSGQLIPLVFPNASPSGKNDYAVSAPEWKLECLDNDQGDPCAEAVPNAQAIYPDSFRQYDHNYPVCYVAGSKVPFTAKTGTQAVSQTQTGYNPVKVAANYPVAGCPIRMTVSSCAASGSSSENISPGAAYTFETNSPLDSLCGMEILQLDFTFSYNDGAAWVPIPGKQSTTHKILRTAGPPKWVDYGSDGITEKYLYTALAEWSCTWAAGGTSAKDVADGCFLHLEETGLKYGVRAWFTADMFNEGGGFCDGWNDFFDHLVTVQGFATDKRTYLLYPLSGTGSETKWESIIIKSPGINRTSPAGTSSNYYCVESGYPVPYFASIYSSSDDIDYYSMQTWWKFGSTAHPDGHCINFVAHNGEVYFYDASFRPAFGPTPRAGTFASVPSACYMTGSALAGFKTIYYNSAIDYHRGRVYYDKDGDGSTDGIGILDVKTSLFGPEELRLRWLEEE
jgi:PKD repeat protein